MKEIKFRGVDLETGEYVYGDFVHYVPMSTFNGIVDKDGFVREIKFGSERQLVGYDKDGNEVYEGDKLTNADGKIYIAHWEPAYRSADLIIRNRNMGVIDDWEYAATYAVDKAEQLVSVDKNGKEIYTGDLVVDDGGEEFIAVLVPMMIDIKGNYFHITDEVVLQEEKNGDQNTSR